MEDTKLIALSRNALLSLFKSDLELFSILILNIAREACRRLHKTDEILLHYVLKKTCLMRLSMSEYELKNVGILR